MSKSIRDQLIAARSKIQSQIDELGISPTGGDWYGFSACSNKRKELISMLKAKLQEIDDALAGLGSDDNDDSPTTDA
jgi:hypothetical protein